MTTPSKNFNTRFMVSQNSGVKRCLCVRARKTVDLIRRIRELLSVFSLVGFFLLVLDSCIALNRWWFEEGNSLSFLIYIENLIFMVLGFTFFTTLPQDRSWRQSSMYYFCVAVYFICKNEFGGHSMRARII